MRRLPATLVTILTTAALTFTVAAAPAEAASQHRSRSLDLAGLWPLNEGQGQRALDWSFSGNNGQLGTTSGADPADPAWVTLSSPWWFRRSALRFSGAQHVRIPNAPSLEPDGVTVVTRVRSTGAGAYRYVMSKGALSCERASYGLYTGAHGGLVFYVSDGSGYTLSADAGAGIWDGAWHTVRGTFDGTSVSLWVDGTLIGAPVPAPVDIAYGLPDGQDFLLGDYAGPCGSPLGFVGDFDSAALVGHYDLSLQPVG